ncbi:MAG TPA: hypothetical protein VL854_06485 [Nitrososphaeraceae archaeon]|nr:hypothetical protein [Nitrososphaeraceae archaeon]
MSSQDPNPLPYGALPYYQVHFIVDSVKVVDPAIFMAKCEPITRGHFRNKSVIDLQWSGGRLAGILKSDRTLSEMLMSLMLDEGEISIDPQNNRVRIYTRWKREDNLKFSLKLFNAIERIATTIRQLSK